ncbi:MAG: hypothetical protein ORN54_08570 [Cyclobacteriaceae bacterium]|nr:hypothetical protein [Cyclobacteriaceae bacterium]
MVKFITGILEANDRPYNHFTNGKLTEMKAAPVTIVESPIFDEILSYKHHVVLVSPDETELSKLGELFDATPKSGMIVYPEKEAAIKVLATKERADVQTLSYKTIPHEVKDGKIFLVSSTNEKFPVKLSATMDLLLLAAAKELVLKIGISSSQFYKTASTLE